jgi:hypothetical protein
VNVISIFVIFDTRFVLTVRGLLSGLNLALALAFSVCRLARRRALALSVCRVVRRFMCGLWWVEGNNNNEK